MGNIRHGHSSSRYDRSPKSLAEQVGRLVDQDGDRTGNLLTYTEVGTPERADKLRADGWGRFVPQNKTDCAVMWLKADWTKVHTEVALLTDKTWVDGHGNSHKTKCATVVLDHRDGHRLWVAVAHLPSEVQDGDAFADHPAKVEAWKDAVDNWPEYQAEQRDLWFHDRQMYVADWNVDLRSAHWRGYLNDVFPKCDPTWRKGHMPEDGTHNLGLIDATYTSAKYLKVGLLKDDDSSDHRPYGEKIGWND